MDPELAFKPITVTDHALWRARQRFREIGEEQIRQDVREALLADRTTEDEVGWIHYKPRRKHALVWTELRERLYVVGLGARRVFVLTALDQCRNGR